MDHGRDEYYVADVADYAAAGAEGESEFRKVPRDLLFWMFSTWDSSLRASVIRVCKRWNWIGTAAFDVFRTNKAFLYGMFLDSKHLSRLLSDSRLPRGYLEDPSILAVMFSRVAEHGVLFDVARRGIQSADTWMICFEAAVRASNASAVQTLLLHEQSEAATHHMDQVAQMVLSKQDAIILHATCNRYLAQLAPLFGASAMTIWCCLNAYAVSLAELLRRPEFCTVHNLVLVLRYALVNHLEPLAFAVWGKGVLSARRSGKSTLLKCCAHNWVRLACLLMQQASLRTGFHPLCSFGSLLTTVTGDATR
jgi:hypothetical protein